VSRAGDGLLRADLGQNPTDSGSEEKKKKKKVEFKSHATELDHRISHKIERNRPTELASGVEEFKVLTYLTRDL
jgi:hypothetical protein